MAIYQHINDQHSSSHEMPCSTRSQLTTMPVESNNANVLLYEKPSVEELASEENTGLALALDAEIKNEMLLLKTTVALQSSPMFRAVIESYGKDPEAIAALRLEITSDEEFEQASSDSYPIRELCARMFLAGQLAEGQDAIDRAHRS